MHLDSADLDRPASLTLWESGPTAPKAVEPHSYGSLRLALAEARRALAEDDATPWITTDSGLILTPGWLRAHFARMAMPRWKERTASGAVAARAPLEAALRQRPREAAPPPG
ncbi:MULTISPECIES: hypothetical protein [Methylobacterium]|uniref:Uncharacterized protein n=1 Tax=Methylobacterium jeotgali TaxID=381630 RepID=A0ABQ4T0W2_9HYPH|nr:MULTISPECIES: hypothetical protein [Methylobacterium]PIU06256.1 MAG: hypothetical protein COT56_10570 [Methylobacterium sp. CG09_land_8_20_14_0_10_71_15]PIU14547.1 MAG: hypothetical protein COT28_07835 [Methylobacterium sp. CG08_land_8_20_14_0_20_71_15]GBU18981.1 hypothetical protein AwMethylo_31960 [Methylobacterium sp.]GJE07521.1 hypothetical protein AOPFMNJM_2850 [Methylobacterium jeotgali]